ncbi:ABC-type multidrug transport system ATPase subunit [Plantactinospora soyae]|uniref:ABC-type multidrug transport system ATPase subunit n=1 Tax=Plantactinospora soyae TaxID=1544732 RepID=A0A927M0L5_9ACTN|nr:ABC transporter ATP-binding protein [Plantactinospora soyae]MBE1484587.1 ABC-type multidrug transport system ATPase subunit [Plantactinospora soyae]
MILRTEELDVGYRDRVLIRGLRLAVDAGDVLAVTGPNGVGKSTLLRCLAGLSRPLGGRILVQGAPADERSPAFRRTVASLLETAAWYPNLTAGEHLEFVQLVNRPVPPGWFEAGALAARLGVARFASVLPGRLSTGQRQRLALALVLARPSRLLLLDEPERHLDEAGRTAVGALLREYARRAGAVVLASHDPTLIAAAGAQPLDVPDWHG